jgi:glycerate kinase
MGNPIKASYLTFNDNKTAWIELSKATGLADMPVEKRNITPNLYFW